jgi:hypothetical protein
VAAGPLKKYPGSKLSLGAGSLLALILLTGLIEARGWRGSGPDAGDYAPGAEAVIIRRIHVIGRGVSGEANEDGGVAPLPAPSSAGGFVEQPVTRTRGS